ncbi:TlpA family protein disulfide reductase [candidate division KSB1 bacterium]|nr:TlpA family protein disulfide reductase [candidate division KSB1 bacterium]
MKKIVLIILVTPIVLFSQNLSNLKFQNLSGNTVTIKDHLANDATIVLFWATWCIPCKEEFPVIQKLTQKYEDKKIKVIAISQDSPRSLAKVKSYTRTHDYGFMYLTDQKEIAKSKLLVTSVPFTMLLNKQGKVIYNHSGYLPGDEKELEQHILKLWEQKEKMQSEGKIE